MGSLRRFKSNEGYFAAIDTLADGLDTRGHSAAAAGIRYALSLNMGLTDGWAAMLDGLVAVDRGYRRSMPPDDRTELRRLIQVAHNAVYRR